MDTGFLDRIAVGLAVENVNPCMVDGEPVFLAILHPNAIKTLRADSLWANAQYYVAEKGKKNPLFSGSVGMWNGFIVRESNKIATAIQFQTAAASSAGGTIDTLTAESATTSSVAAADIRINIVLGANAVARAYGVESYMAKRKEDDYGNLIGFGGGSIYGDKRVDWVNEAANDTDNQSSLLAYSYSPSVSGLSIW
jgi:N4-gp56 family major capsid protein